jgi:hypothetical protein
LSYADPSDHHVTQMGSNTHGYDAKGSLRAVRLHAGYDAENCITGYLSGAVSTTFPYDGDDRRVKGTVNGVLSYLLTDHLGSITVTVNSTGVVD